MNAAIRGVVLLAGAVLMATEVLAFRVIGRTFGSALRETTAVIAVFLAAMSLGYYLGGRIGDRAPRASTLVVPLLVAGAWIVLLPLMDVPVSDRVALSSLPFATHALLTNLLLFFVPAALLAAVSPVAIRLLATDLAHTGRVAGGISALSAVGSIVGTIAAGFYLLGHFPVSDTFRALGALSMVLAGVSAIAGRRAAAAPVPDAEPGAGRDTRRVLSSVALALGLGVLALTATGTGTARASSDAVVYEFDSAYHHIRVIDEGPFRVLRFDDSRQSRMLRSDPVKGGFGYTDLFHTILLFDETPGEVLFIGLGGGTGPKQFLHDYPDVRVRVAEVDPHVVRVAREYFALPPDGPRLRVGVMDGRQALRRTRGEVDAIVVDAYNAGRYGSTIPFHLTTREFFELCAERLTDDGMVVYNVIESMTDAWSTDFLLALVKTVGEVFPETYLFDSDTSRNTIVVAVKTAREATAEGLVALAEDLVAREVVTNEGFVDDVRHLYEGEIDLEEVIVLTDDYAPVDRLLGR